MLRGALRVERDGTVVDTSATVGPAEMSVELRPARPWSPGSYRLLVDPRLEDPSGNSVRRPFETRVGEPSREETAAALTFELES